MYFEMNKWVQKAAIEHFQPPSEFWGSTQPTLKEAWAT